MKLQNKLLLSEIISSTLLVGLMLVLMQWSVERGMLDYVNTREEARLAPALEKLAQVYQESGSWAALQAEPRRFYQIMRVSGDRPRPRPGLYAGEPLPPPSVLHAGEPPPPRGPSGRKPQLLDSEQDIVIGYASAADDFRLLPISQGGDIVGWLAMPPLRKITEGYELRFLQQQWQTFIAIGLIVIALAFLVSYLLSRHLLKPVTSMARATELLSQGDFSSRLQVDRRDELGQLARDFNELAESLQQSETGRRRWFADVSHELRTPLAILYAQIEAMLDGVRPLDRKGVLSIQHEVRQLNTLVDDLYTLSSAELGSLQYHKEVVDLRELLKVQLQLHESQVLGAGLQLIFDSTPAAVYVWADHARLCQLLDNLLLNSSKYTDAGGELRVTLSCTGDEGCILIEDSAPAVPEEALAQLFDHLYRVDVSRNRSTGGSGLGLAICQCIVTAHSGQIDLSLSSIGGLAVNIRLPLHKLAVI